MKQVIKQQLTGRFAIIKVFPFIHALKVEVCETFHRVPMEARFRQGYSRP